MPDVERKKKAGSLVKLEFPILFLATLLPGNVNGTGVWTALGVARMDIMKVLTFEENTRLN